MKLDLFGRFAASMSVVVTLAGLLGTSPDAVAQNPAGPPGTYITCTNACITVPNPDGTFSIQDCCGGRVMMVIIPAPESGEIED